MNSRALAGLGGAAAALALAGAGFWLHRRQPTELAAAAPSASVAPPASARPKVRPNPHAPRESRALIWPFEDPVPAVVPVAGAEETAPIRAMPPEARRAEHARRKAADGGARFAYPPGCRPASTARARILPRHPTVVVRPLGQGAMERGLALVRARQDRDHLVLGDEARLMLEVAVDGARVPFTVDGAELLGPRPAPSAQPESLGSVAFRNDGVPPDEKANDGVQTASVSLAASQKDLVGDLTVRAKVSTANESGEVRFPLVASGAAPAEFSGSVREALEHGALAFYVGVRVTQKGRYVFTGRVYDSKHRAMAILDANVDLDTGAHDVRLEMCGRLLADEGVPGPWELRDVEGFLLGEISGRPELVPMRVFKGPHRTRVYPLGAFEAE